MKSFISFLFVLLLQSCATAELKISKDISYKPSASNSYEKERCKLDLYQSGKSNSPVLVWFHGGGIQKGSKEKKDEVVDIAKKFAEHGVSFVAVNYRLHPKVKFPAYIDDVAASIQWTISNAEKYDIDPQKVFVGGHSAGAYLTMMSIFENGSTNKAGLKVKEIAGAIPVSGQTITHSTVRKEMGIPRSTVMVDKHAPLYHHNKIKIPVFLIAGDKDLKMRAAESILLYSGIKDYSTFNKYKEYPDRDHVTIVTDMVKDQDPVFLDILGFIKEVSKNN